MAVVTGSTTAAADQPMIDRILPRTSPVTPAGDLRTMLRHAVSRGAVLAGAVVALITHVIPNMLGLVIGRSTVDPMGNRTLAAFLVGHGSAVDPVMIGAHRVRLVSHRA